MRFTNRFEILWSLDEIGYTAQLEVFDEDEETYVKTLRGSHIINHLLL
jgi:hypothetical protein